VYSRVFIGVVFMALAAMAQKPLAFDAASVKPDTPMGPGATDDAGRTKDRKQPGGDGGRDAESPGRIHYPHTALTTLLMKAYDVDRLQIQGPDWLGGTRFQIDATMPPETNREQVRRMLQNLQTERFKLATHREKKQLAGFALVVAKNGPKLKASTDAGPVGPPPDPRRPPSLGPDGFPTSIPRVGKSADQGILMFSAPYGVKLFFFGKTMHDLANELWERLRTPVRGATSLASAYDFSLTYSPDDRPAASAPDVFKALESQLSLRLVKSKVTVDMLVVDHIEKVPTENE